MKKVIVTVILMACILGGLSAQALGTGITVFIPESLWLAKSGTASLETSMGTSVGLGKMFSLPLGATYLKTDGLRVKGSSTTYNDYQDALKPWFLSDLLIAYLMAEFRLDLGPVYLKADGGGLASFLITKTPLLGNIEDFYLSRTGADAVHLANIDPDYRFGFGWQAGGSLGVSIGDSIEVELSALYRSISYGGSFRADMTQVSGTVASPSSLSESIDLLLQGLSVGIGGSFNF